MLKTGLYEQIIDRALAEALEASKDIYIADKGKIDKEEASLVLANYTSKIIKKSLDHLKDSHKSVGEQISFINKLISNIIQETDNHDFSEMSVDERAEQLLALVENKNRLPQDTAKTNLPRPVTSIAFSSLFTGAKNEPDLSSEFIKEIASSDSINILVSFIRWSGLRLIINELKDFTINGGKLRVITTSYMGATDLKAVVELSKLPNTEIKISYDTKRTRLHAKTYIFVRETGFTTAYVGSSNLSNAAMSSGLEWNIKVAKKDMPETIDKINATFESYWNSNEFEMYFESNRNKLAASLKSERISGNAFDGQYYFDISPYPFQQEILKQLEAERTIKDHYRNLVVAATGTGKTVISAFDYRDFCRNRPGEKSRLLFVAHREEILKQSVACFRGILRDPNFGELFVGSYRPENPDYLFMSIQTFNSQNFTSSTEPDYYDYIIVDEFHHAAADSYQKLLSYYKPKILLGLTATPERMDGKSVLTYFNDRIAAEIRLPEAIERKLLSPFQYFGVTDYADLSGLKWTSGRYDTRELTNLFTIDRAVADKRAAMTIESIIKYVTDLDKVKALGFCVSVEHAEYMSRFFNEKGLPSICLTSKTPDDERNAAKQRLTKGEIQYIFVVDLYNEGVDIPEVNTVLFLRPTESLTVFLQQLGRGLRLAEDKECLTVLDFIGQAHKKYNFEDKFKALLANTSRSMEKEIKDGFISVPKGCYIQLEPMAAKYILNNIRKSFDTTAGLVSRIETFVEDSGLSLTLENFTNYYHLDVRNIYKRGTFSKLCVFAGAKKDFNEPLEKIMGNAFLRLSYINSRRWLRFLINLFKSGGKINFKEMVPEERRMLNMFTYSVLEKAYPDLNFDLVTELKSSPTMLAEFIELLEYNYSKIDFIDKKIDLGFKCPLDLHCTYTRDQILLAMDHIDPSNVREGVKWIQDKQTDIFFITLNKSDKDYSPSTMYKDYSINESLFHWQSQSTTASDSNTGKRYINHRSLGSKIMLFVREHKRNSFGTEPYTFLGTANYVSHEGSKPMNIMWKLDEPIPAKYLKKTNQLIAG